MSATRTHSHRAEAKVLFSRFCRTIGKSEGTSPGCLSLDYTACYGGYAIIEYMEGGGESKPFGRERFTPRDFCSAITLAIETAEYLRREQK